RAQTYREIARQDPLTELISRRAFEDELHAVAQDPDGGVAVLLIDVDGLRAVNEAEGEPAGDRLLAAVGTAIAASVRPGDVIARFGGDEFAVLLHSATVPVACAVGDRMRSAVAGIPAGAGVTMSIGVAALSSDPRRDLLAA